MDDAFDDVHATVRGAPAVALTDAGLGDDPLLGRVLAEKYRIDALIGSGGMGSVYRATQLTVARLVAVKVLRPVPGVSAGHLAQRFQREALATSRLKHPNTVQVIDFGQTSDGVLFLVLELLEGTLLSDAIAASAPMAPERVAAIGRQIARALAEAHEQGIIHRDLKPDNVFLCSFRGDADVAKVMDFGIAHMATAETSMTQTGMMIGTPRYIAPEQAMGHKVGPSADLYALGVILFEMLTGHAPFEADSVMSLAYAHIHEPPPRLEVPDASPELLASWREVLAALLAKSPAARPASAAEVALWLGRLEALAERAAGLARNPLHKPLPGRDPTLSGLTAPRRPQPSRVRRSRGDLAMFLATVVFMGLGGLLAWWLSR
jgi:serine/threonine-protein kinase